MHTVPRNTTLRDFGDFAIACRARNLTAQLDALKARPQGRIPATAQDIDAPQTETYVPGLSSFAAKAGA